MKTLSQFTIPYKGLGIGKHEYIFEVDSAFFREFEDSSIKDGEFTVKVILDKKSDHCILLFDIDGYTKTTCDRCLANINLPIKGDYRLIIKFAQEMEVEEDDEILFLHPDTSTLQLAQYIYEYIHLSLPLVCVFDCNPEVDCDLTVLNRLEEIEDDVDEDINEVKNNTIWDSLKDLDLDK